MMSNRKGQNGRDPMQHANDAITNEPWQGFSVCGTYSQRLTADPKLVKCGNIGDIHLWGACLQQGNDPQAAYPRTWASPTPYQQSGVAAGPTGIAQPRRCVWPGSARSHQDRRWSAQL